MLKNYLLLPGFLALILFTGAPDISAQSRDDQWNRVVSLRSGTRIIVDQDGKKAVKAKFLHATEQIMTVTSGGKQIAIARSDIAAVYLGKSGSRTKSTVIGALAGAGAGVTAGVIATVAAKADPLTAAGGFLIGVPAGAVIGFFTGGGMKKGELVYSR